MKCSKCRYYSHGLQRCKLAKINPRTIKGGVEAMKIFGINYLCAVDNANLSRRKKMVHILLQEIVERDTKNRYEEHEPLTGI